MTGAAIEVAGLSYAYPDGRAALAGVGMRVEEGESVGLLGPNGAGKSTLLMHLNGMLRGKGLVKIFGMEVANGNLRTIRSKIGLVFQDPESQLFCPTLFDDVAFGPLNLGLRREEVEERVREALVAVGLAEAGARSPHHMSMGEKKRAALATVLAMRPAALVVDEPSANLDPRSRRELIGLLKGLTVTKLIASHDLDLVGKLCGRVILMNGGRVAVEGEAASLLGDEKLLRANGL